MLFGKYLTVCGVLLLAIVGCVRAMPEEDRVHSLPGFDDETWTSKFSAYSGFLNVIYPSPIAGYSGVVIHYQFHTSQGNPEKDPLLIWHTGGPGGSSIYGQYSEMGPFQVFLDDNGEVDTAFNPYAWNNVANTLYLEAPAGSFLTPVDLKSGFSYCLKDGVRQDKCHWNDVTQAQSYAYTLKAFFEKFPELQSSDIYLSGESYGGQYVPNIAYEILNNHKDLSARLKGLAVGNGCWGGSENEVVCNGPFEDRDDVRLYWGKGMVSDELHASIQESCTFPNVTHKCEQLLDQMSDEVGPHNVYNVYDNCPDTGSNVHAWLRESGKSMRFLRKFLRARAHDLASAHAELTEMGGGYSWTCGQFDALPRYFKRTDVRAALNLPNENGAIFSFSSTGPASVTLYPTLIQSNMRVLIYNGDADSCVPYIGNIEWTQSMETQGIVKKESAWHPWYATSEQSSVAGYATAYSNDFSFVTIRLAGHQVPQNMPATSLNMISRFLDGSGF